MPLFRALNVTMQPAGREALRAHALIQSAALIDLADALADAGFEPPAGASPQDIRGAAFALWVFRPAAIDDALAQQAETDAATH